VPGSAYRSWWQIISGDHERVAVQRDVPDVGTIDHLVPTEILMRYGSA
jgi:hypothetical protein